MILLSLHFLCTDITPVVTTSSLTATSVTISWTQPEFMLPAPYTVSLTRVTGSGQVLCPSVQDVRPAVTTSGNSTSFTSLEEFSVYMVTVSITVGTNTRAASKEFTTLSASMYNSHCGYCNSFIIMVCFKQLPLELHVM